MLIMEILELICRMFDLVDFVGMLFDLVHSIFVFFRELR